ncbi:MAG TPA: right-handed parallel beta-helix repeat-containing protein [Lysobacter sp.]
MTAMTRLVAALVSLAAVAVHGEVRAAESYDNCTGFINSLPATISTQGTWCLSKHLFTSMTSGAAITLATDNVTIDCNHFRLSGFGAGAATDASGISAGASRLNATVRRCRIQGFKYGVLLYGSGHLVEDNQFDGSTRTGIYVHGDAVVRDNFVTDTGGRPGDVYSYGIYALGSGSGAQVLDNTIRGIAPVGDGGGNKGPVGIHLLNGMAQGNRIGGLLPGGTFDAQGIVLVDATVARDNLLTQLTATTGVGIQGAGTGDSLCQDNTVQRYAVGIDSCQLAGSNGVQP